MQAREAAEEQDPYTRMLDAYEPTLHHLLQSGSATPPDKVVVGSASMLLHLVTFVYQCSMCHLPQVAMS
jgi:hypothetical protein